MRIAIVGAGIAGMTAAYDLAQAGEHVTLYEASAHAGGLAAGFRDSQWDWPLERFYHHLFVTDRAIRTLVDRIGMRDQLFFRTPITAQWWHGRGYALTGARPAVRLPGRQTPYQLPVPDLIAGGLSVLAFPGVPLADRLRLNVLLAYLKFGIRDWRPLEQVTAAAWTRRMAGEQLYRAFFQPLLDGKFGPYAEQVNMSWLWARFKARSVALGYFVGGFQHFSDRLQAAVQRAGATIHMHTPIGRLTQCEDGAWHVETARGESATFDAVIVTGAPRLLATLAPQLPHVYTNQLQRLDSLGAVVLTLALHQPLTGGLYWVNLSKAEFPFLALVEHTNFIESAHYGGDHLVYCGDYLEPSHAYFQMSLDQLIDRFIPALTRINARFDRSWIRDAWLHREAYAQPIVPVNHGRTIPPLATPLAGLFWASMSQVYPWDRGTNYAVELGQQVAQAVLAERVRLPGRLPATETEPSQQRSR